ncbi:MAG: sugar transferase [Planctomycetota bacterium]
MAFWATRYEHLRRGLALRRGKLLFAFDLLLILASFLAAFGRPADAAMVALLLLGPVLWTAMSEELYHPQRGAPISSLRQALRDTGWVSVVVLIVWAAGDLPLYLGGIPLSRIGPHLAFLWTSLFATHTLARLIVCLLRRRGLDFKPALVCGPGAAAKEIAAYLRAHPGLGFSLAADAVCEPTHLPSEARRREVETVFLCAPQPAVRSAAQSLAALTGLEVLEVLDRPAETVRAPRWIGSLAVAPLNSTPFHHLIFKRLTDVTLALALLVVLSPLLLAVACLIRLTSRGPVLFRQPRLALGGRTFTLYKFRTMQLSNQPEHSIHTDPNDPRITWVGRLLRPIFLDELPQLFNVAMGDMSLVGPRPERCWAADRLTREIADYGLRLAVKPGLTGLAQVDGLHGNCDMKKRVERDLAYIAHSGLTVDFKILVRTAVKTGKHLVGVRG